MFQDFFGLNLSKVIINSVYNILGRIDELNPVSEQFSITNRNDYVLFKILFYQRRVEKFETKNLYFSICVDISVIYGSM